MKKLFTYGLGLLFIFESIYFNIVLDFLLILLLLTVSISIGNFFKFKILNIEFILVKLALGIGITGTFIWFTVLYDFHHKSLFLLLSILVIILKYKDTLKDLLYVKECLGIVYKAYFLIFLVVIIGFLFLIIPSVYPISQWDSLAKHIVIPSQILNYGYNNYNIKESIIFGDFAIFVHMLYFYLMVLGGVKALVLFNAVISLFTIISILRFSYFITNKSLVLISIAILYFTTPLIYTYSTTLCVDIYPIFFIAISLLIIIKCKEIDFLLKNLPFIALLFGFGFFSKQVAFYMIIPLSLYIFYILIRNFKLLNYKALIVVFLSMGIFFIPFLPSILLIWYKTGNPLFPFLNGVFQSKYFNPINFKDPYIIWERFLELDFNSIKLMVFNTSRNTEYMDGGLGLHILVIPLAILVTLFVRNRNLVILFLITIGSYFISIEFFNPNIRYFIGAITFALPFTLITIYLLIEKIVLNKIIKSTVFIGLVLFSFLFNIHIIFDKNNFLGFKKDMLKVNNELTSTEVDEILKYINNKEIYLLSNNEYLRGTFNGHFYTLTWYNTYLVEKIKKGEISLFEFLSMFDYYLIKKDAQEKESILLNNFNISENLELVRETKSHILYKIKKIEKIVLENVFDNPLIVDVAAPKSEIFSNNFKAYKIQIEAEPMSKNDNTYGRFQINWLNEKGDFIGTSISIFKLDEKQKKYISHEIVDMPIGTVSGQLFLTSHSEDKIKVFAFKLIGIKTNKLINEL